MPWRHQAILLGTGAAALALELLASRVLTPYFGVSLYIWAGVLSITLIFLALGYRVGGVLADLGSEERLETLASRRRSPRPSPSVSRAGSIRRSSRRWPGRTWSWAASQARRCCSRHRWLHWRP